MERPRTVIDLDEIVDDHTKCSGMCSRRLSTLRDLLQAIEQRWPDLRGVVKDPAELMRYDSLYPQLKGISVAYVNSRDDRRGYFFSSIIEFITCILKPAMWDAEGRCWLAKKMHYEVWRATNPTHWRNMLCFFGPPGSNPRGGNYSVPTEDNESKYVRDCLRPKIERACGVNKLSQSVRNMLWGLCKILGKATKFAPPADPTREKYKKWLVTRQACAIHLARYGHTGHLLNSAAHPILRRMLVTIHDDVPGMGSARHVEFVGTVESLVYDYVVLGRQFESLANGASRKFVIRAYDATSPGFSTLYVLRTMGKTFDRSMEGVINTAVHAVFRQCREPLPSGDTPPGVFDPSRVRNQDITGVFDRQRAESQTTDDGQGVVSAVEDCAEKLSAVSIAMYQSATDN